MRAGTPAPLHLVFVATLPEPGGACTHTTNLVAALLDAGHRITVVATPGRGVWEELEAQEHPQLARVAATFRTAFDADASAVVSRVLHDARADHVFAVFEQDYWGALRVARRARVPVSFFLHHAGMKRTNRLLLPFARPTYIVPSDDLRAWIVARRIPRSRVQVLANPIDTAYFAPDEAVRAATRAALGFRDTDVVVGFVGRLEHNKGIVPFAEALNAAMREQPALRALWIGSGRREAEVDAVIAQAPAPEHHVRQAWTRDVRACYQAMDIVALPSTGRESFGRVLAEAQSCEKPVLGSAIGGIPTTMDVGVSGALVPPGDVAAWTQALCALAAAPERRAAMGRAGRAFVQAHYDRQRVAGALVAFVESVRDGSR
jgi:glycosyltransferase involved in cell wall biosynthesis